MTTHALKLKLAALDGWKPVPANGFVMYKRGAFSVNSHHDLPDYANDLNALRRIERNLAPMQQHEYAEMCQIEGGLTHTFNAMTVSAFKRAEALLIVLGK